MKMSLELKIMLTVVVSIILASLCTTMILNPVIAAIGGACFLIITHIWVATGLLVGLLRSLGGK